MLTTLYTEAFSAWSLLKALELLEPGSYENLDFKEFYRQLQYDEAIYERENRIDKNHLY
jgi:hypothetical protein